MSLKRANKPEKIIIPHASVGYKLPQQGFYFGMDSDSLDLKPRERQHPGPHQYRSEPEPREQHIRDELDPTESSDYNTMIYKDLIDSHARMLYGILGGKIPMEIAIMIAKKNIQSEMATTGVQPFAKF